jgi:hypothetical protein
MALLLLPVLLLLLHLAGMHMSLHTTTLKAGASAACGLA